jgi:ribosomal protein S20
MAYKNIEDRKAASRRHYQANKSKYLARNKQYRSSIREFVKSLKQSTPCKDCGKRYPSYVMDFDHLEDKENIISFLMSSGRIGALKREIQKCEIVCANCHRGRTHDRLAKNKRP